MNLVGVYGFEPLSYKARGLQPLPTLPLRRTPMLLQAAILTTFALTIGTVKRGPAAIGWELPYRSPGTFNSSLSVCVQCTIIDPIWWNG